MQITIMRLLTKYGKIHSNKNVRRRSSTQYSIYFDFSSTISRSTQEVSMTPMRRKTAPNSTTSPLPFDLSYFHLPFGYQLRITRELWSINPHKSSELITDIIHFRVGRYSCAVVQIYSHRRSFAELNLNSVEAKINISKHEVTIDKQKYAHG